MGAFHGETLAHRLPGVELAGVADVDESLAREVAERLDCEVWTTDLSQLLSDGSLDAVVVATPSRFHADTIEAAARAGKSVFCEKPIAEELADADRAIRATRDAGVPFQIGFQRRFDRGYLNAHELVQSGELGNVQLMRSTTRDPALDHPERAPRWAVFRETLIHDFDVLRYFAGPGNEPVEVFAWADTLIRPDWKDRGLLDTASVSVRFSNGALAYADASFQAVYGYDVRAEVFGSKGLATVGDGRESTLVHHTAEGECATRKRWFADLFRDAYVAELGHFVECVRNGRTPKVTGEDGRAALAMAHAAIRSVQEGRPVKISEVG
jgi:myo-inositol 2-dehydrogenase/D-chiro-inositol 1-dehydrogenase